MSYEGGYTSALNANQRRELEAISAMFNRQQMQQRAIMFEQAQREQQRQRAARQALGNMLPELMAGGDPSAMGVGGPQPPMPGMSSPPMIPPGAGAGGPPTPPPAALPPPPGAPMPQGAGPGAPMAPPPGVKMAPPSAAGAPGGGQAPVAPPMPWKALPAPPKAMPGGDQPPTIGAPPENAVMPRKVLSILDMAKLLKAKGVQGEDAIDMLEAWKPFMDSENKTQLDLMTRENAALKAAVEAYKAAKTAGNQERTSAERERHDRATEAQGAQRNAILRAKYGGGEPGKPGIASAKPMDEADQLALDAQAWTYIKTRTLPYRKGTGGGKDKNDLVMRRVGEIARDLGMDAETLMNQPAEFKANAQSLAFQTKKLDAIEGQLRSFHNNLDTWDSLAKGMAPKLGGERVAAMAKDLKKIDFVGIKSFDEMKLRIEQQFDDPTTSAYMVAAMAAAMDYARIMQGPQSIASLTEGARKDAERLISAGFDDKARRAVIGALESDTEGQVKGIRDQRDAITARMKVGGKPRSGEEAVREFATEAEAAAAGLDDGARVKIGGKLGKWKKQ